MEVLTGCVLGLPNCSAERPCALHNKYEGKKRFSSLRLPVESLSEEANIQTFLNISCLPGWWPI